MHSRARIILAISYILLSLSISTSTYAEKSQPSKFVLAFTGEKGSALEHWLTLTYNDLFHRVGIETEIIWLPNARADYYAEIGKIDAQTGRIASYQDKHPSQIRVNVPVYQINVNTYVLRSSPNLSLNNWSDLDNTNLDIDYVRGVVITENRLSKLTNWGEVNTVTTAKKGLLKLKAGRTDIFICSELACLPYINNPEFYNHIKEAGTLETVNLYLYVHVKHHNLVTKLEKEILEMQQNKIITDYKKETFK